ncbi:MAG: hypothetical protein K2K95_06450, partial [Muribaculaceae bacterium]|nr:hypothetical protein [Muribaculaceae bacterium]
MSNQKTDNKNKKKGDTPVHTETRHTVIYGYTRQELSKVMKHFESQLPEFVKISIETNHLVTRITLTG